MIDTVINYLDKFGPELLVIQFGFLVILSTLFLWLWFSNRRKYHNLKHAIPANVVKSYLDSIIQNSTALKSQLFRGGGQDVENVPSVMPLQNLTGGDGLAISGAPSTALLEEVNQKKAQIASLEVQLSSLQGSGKEFERKLATTQGNLSTAENKIKELEALLAQVKSGAAEGGAGGAGVNEAVLQTELDMVTKERDEIRDRLKEFEIISDDLANLKRLQQENEQLKKSLAALGGAPQAKAAEPVSPAKEQTDIISQADVSELLEDLGRTASAEGSGALENFLSQTSDEVAGAEEDVTESEEVPVEEETPTEATAEAATESSDENLAAGSPEAEAEDKSKAEKTPEDLLSEFEKMLG